MSTDTRQRADKHGEDRARAAVLEVTKTMLDEVGYQHLRVEAVAARAGVPRAWLRRWWTTRPLLVAEAVQRMGGPPDIVPTGDVRADVRAVVLRTAAFLANPVVGDALTGLLADATRDPVAAERLATLLATRRASDAAVLLSAVARGDLHPDTDVPLLLDVVFGALLFRLGRGTPPTPAVVDALVELALGGQGTLPKQEGDGNQVHDHAHDGYELDGSAPDGHRLGGQRRDGRREVGSGLFASEPFDTTDGQREAAADDDVAVRDAAVRDLGV
jgi:AcrR family transcriptional regulator